MTFPRQQRSGSRFSPHVAPVGVREDWMWELGAHWTSMRRAYPDETLAVVFDIDGTILDMRHLVVRTLLTYDATNATEHFRGLQPDDVDVHESRIEPLLDRLALPASVRDDVLRAYALDLWDPAAFLVAHRPFDGVLSVIRWFQLQPGAVVALNTGRPEPLRADTLGSLNALGREFRVRFDDRFLLMADDEADDVPAVKVAALDRLRELGVRPVVAVDNEPANIRAMAEADVAGELLFLHADTIFESRRSPTPRTVRGTTYGLSSLVSERELARRVRFVWHGVNDEANLRQFLASEVAWAESDVRLDPVGRVVLRHDGYDETAWHRDERPLPLSECLHAVRDAERCIKLDVKQNGTLLDATLEAVAGAGFSDAALWFNAEIDVLGEGGLRRIAAAHPGAVLSCPIDFLAPLVAAAPEVADAVLERLASWGVNRLSIAWTTAHVRDLVDAFESRGWAVNVYGVPDLEAFLEASLLLPASVTADFNFPEWHYFGRGSGQRRGHHRYALISDP